jgi:hypothetical protein
VVGQEVTELQGRVTGTTAYFPTAEGGRPRWFVHRVLPQAVDALRSAARRQNRERSERWLTERHDRHVREGLVYAQVHLHRDARFRALLGEALDGDKAAEGALADHLEEMGLVPAAEALRRAWAGTRGPLGERVLEHLVAPTA